MNDWEHVVIDTEEISTFLYAQLLCRGYVPDEDEVDDIADILFEFLLQKSMIKEVFDEEK